MTANRTRASRRDRPAGSLRFDDILADVDGVRLERDHGLESGLTVVTEATPKAVKPLIDSMLEAVAAREPGKHGDGLLEEVTGGHLRPAANGDALVSLRDVLVGDAHLTVQDSPIVARSAQKLLCRAFQVPGQTSVPLRCQDREVVSELSGAHRVNAPNTAHDVSKVDKHEPVRGCASEDSVDHLFDGGSESGGLSLAASLCQLDAA